ncbi:MAG: hypothetical protein DBY03_07100 [Clostridiales bacterium]|nr:MAG: hypothetical protein DBY03_07100 [Clostridiales bacterium]
MYAVRYKSERKRIMETNCEFCALYYVDDDGYGECQVNLDEDEMYRFMNTSYRSCPYYQNDDEYKIVRKQN